jgi:hypothetical protein
MFPNSPILAQGDAATGWVAAFEKIDVSDVLLHQGGLAFLSLFLAAVLISISLVRGRTNVADARMVHMFLGVALAFVVTPHVLAFLSPETVPVELKIIKYSDGQPPEGIPVQVSILDRDVDITRSDLKLGLGGGLHSLRINLSRPFEALRIQRQQTGLAEAEKEKLLRIVCKNEAAREYIACPTNPDTQTGGFVESSG